MKIIYSFDGWTENHKFKYPLLAHAHAYTHIYISGNNMIKQWWKGIRHIDSQLDFTVKHMKLRPQRAATVTEDD